MRTVWATVLSVWALLGVVAFLAWTRQQPAPARSPQAIPGAVIVKGKNGTTRLVVVSGTGSTAAHATTRTSPVPAG
jgi:cyanate permease